MCGIFGSFDSQQFINLVIANQHRGTTSHSFMSITKWYDIYELIQHGGAFPFEILPKETGNFWLGHVQAPTGGLHVEGRIHPAILNNFILYHNGIIKAPEVKRLMKEQNTTEEWDTKLLLNHIIVDGKFEPERLNDIDGSFACVLLHIGRGLFIFTNDSAPLHIDWNTLSISSVRVKSMNPKDADYKRIPTNTVYSLDLKEKEIREVVKFQNQNSPYYFGG